MIRFEMQHWNSGALWMNHPPIATQFEKLSGTVESSPGNIECTTTSATEVRHK
jgi:hypothetical protein